jgi:hypothetical protein
LIIAIVRFVGAGCSGTSAPSDKGPPAGHRRTMLGRSEPTGAKPALTVAVAPLARRWLRRRIIIASQAPTIAVHGTIQAPRLRARQSPARPAQGAACSSSATFHQSAEYRRGSPPSPGVIRAGSIGLDGKLTDWLYELTADCPRKQLPAAGARIANENPDARRTAPRNARLPSWARRI